MEQFKTLATTTLSGAIDSSQTTLVVASASNFPTSGVFSLLIDSEIMKVTGVSGTTFTVVRGQESTTGASHSNGATVTSPLTVRSLEALRAEAYTTGLTASFTQQRQGRVYFPTDSPISSYDDGSAVVYFGREAFEKLSLPITGDFSWINQGSATVDDSKGYTVLTDPAGAGDTLRIREKNLPASPWSVVCWLDCSLDFVSFLLAGLCLRESGTSKVRTFEFSSGSEAFLSTTNWTNATTYSSTSNAWSLNKIMGGTPPRWFKLRYDGTNIDFSIGHTKRHMIIYESRAKNYHFTTAPDKVGFFANSNNASYSATLNLYHWEEGT